MTTPGTIYFLSGKYPEATRYYHNALLASREQKNRKDEIDALLFLAKLKRRFGQADSSLYYSRSALGLAQMFGVPGRVRDAYNSLAQDHRLLRHTLTALNTAQSALVARKAENECCRRKFTIA